MAFVSSGLQKIGDLGFPTTSGGSLWLYTSSDPHPTVEGANYLNGAGFGSKSTNAQGMRQGLTLFLKIAAAGRITASCVDIKFYDYVRVVGSHTTTGQHGIFQTLSRSGRQGFNVALDQA